MFAASVAFVMASCAKEPNSGPGLTGGEEAHVIAEILRYILLVEINH
jgi:hypothetical protein